MLRTLLLVVALVVIAGIAIQLDDAGRHEGDAGGNVTVTANPVTVGTENRTVQVPVVRMEERQVQTPTVSVGNAQANGQ